MVQDLMRDRLKELTDEMERLVATRPDIEISELYDATSDSQITDLAVRIWNDGAVPDRFRIVVDKYVSDFTAVPHSARDAVDGRDSLMPIKAIYEGIIAYLSQ